MVAACLWDWQSIHLSVQGDICLQSHYFEFVGCQLFDLNCSLNEQAE